MAGNSLRFGIIGVGNMGNPHATNIKQGKARGATLAAVCDIDPKRLDAVKDLDVPAFDNYTDLLDSGLVDAVIVATPHYWHPAQTIAAAQRGIHVLCEKPISVTVGTAKQMVEQCRKHKVKLGVMFMQRMRPFARKIKQIIDRGQLGDIMRVQMVASSWYRTQFYYNSGGWRGTWLGEGGGILMNQAPHSLDQYVWYAGLPKSVTAMCLTHTHKIEVENTASAILDFGGGKTGYIFSTTAESPGVEEFFIAGTKGTLVARNGKLMQAKLKTPLDKHLRTAQAMFEKPGCEWKDVEVTGKSMDHMGVVARFAKAVREDAPLVADGTDGINEITLCNAIYLAGFGGKPVSLPFEDEQVERLITRLARQLGQPGRENLRGPGMRELRKVLAGKSRRRRRA